MEQKILELLNKIYPIDITKVESVTGARVKEGEVLRQSFFLFD